jgi:TRAP-type C4-dicarboxylate transport system permease large subunit
MGLVSGMVAGLLLGVALMAAWSRMMRRRTTKRVAKVPTARLVVYLLAIYLGIEVVFIHLISYPTHTS